MPDNQKKILSLAVAAILTFIIVITFFSLGDKTAANQVEKEDAKLSSISPIQLIKDEFSKAFSNFNELKDNLESTTTESTSTIIIDEQAIPIEIITKDLATSTEISTITNN
jgi:hypothetical protein